MNLLIIGGVIVAVVSFLDAVGAFPSISQIPVPWIGKNAAIVLTLLGLVTAGAGANMLPSMQFMQGDDGSDTNSTGVDYQVTATTVNNVNLVEDSNHLRVTGQQYNETSDSLTKQTFKVQFTVERFDTVDDSSIFNVNFDSDVQTTNESDSDSPYYVIERRNGEAKVKLTSMEDGEQQTDWTDSRYRVQPTGEVKFNATVTLNTEAVQKGLKAYPETPSSSPEGEFTVAGETFTFQEFVGETKVVS